MKKPAGNLEQELKLMKSRLEQAEGELADKELENAVLMLFLHCLGKETK